MSTGTRTVHGGCPEAVDLQVGAAAGTVETTLLAISPCKSIIQRLIVLHPLQWRVSPDF